MYAVAPLPLSVWSGVKSALANVAANKAARIKIDFFMNLVGGYIPSSLRFYDVNFYCIQKREPTAIGLQGIHSHRIQYMQKAHADA